jgi:hypothetical protein
VVIPRTAYKRHHLGDLLIRYFYRRRRELMRAMAAGAGKNFRTDNVGIATVVR